MIAIQPHAEGAVLPVRARAGARRNQIDGEQNGMLRVSVTQAPEKGKANQGIVALLAKELSLRKSQLALLSGATSPKKRFLVRGVTPEDLSQRIEQALRG